MFLEASSPLDSYLGALDIKKGKKKKALPVKTALAKHLLSTQRAPGPW